jgi:hypothetical protein
MIDLPADLHRPESARGRQCGADIALDVASKTHLEVMMNLWQHLALAILLSLLASAGQASPMVITSPCVNVPSIGCATGIKDLDVRGVLLDVSFSQLSFDDLFASRDPYFLGDFFGAAVAAEAIAAALDRSVIGWPTYAGSYIYIPYDLDFIPPAPGYKIVLTEALREAPLGNWHTIGFHTYGHSGVPAVWNPLYFDSFALFREKCTVCPTPATLALFAMGLLALGVSRRNSDLRLQIT